MARGIQAVAMLICMVLAVSFMASIGAYSSIEAGSYATTQSDSDVNRIVGVFEDQGGSITGVGLVDPFISLAIGALDTAQVMWIIISDTSELFVLYGAPVELANQLETLARVAFGLTFMYLARGVVL